MLISTASLARVDGATWLALACTALGWFGLNTLVASFGPIRHTAHFFDLPAAIADPLWLLRGLSAAHGFGTAVFVIICLLFLAAAAAAFARSAGARAPWGSFAPLTLMLLCSIVFYIKASATHIEPGTGMGPVGGWIAHAANGAIAWTGDVVARHVTVGGGGYLSFAASGWLAWRGFQALRRAREEKRLVAR